MNDSPYSLRDEKNMLREHYSKLRRSIDKDRKEKIDMAIVGRISGLRSYCYANAVLLYYPKGDEINLLPLARQAISEGKRVLFPVSDHDGVMHYRQVSDIDSDFVPGMFGILEPKKSCPVFDKSNVGGSAIVIMPALSIDRDGYRLGYGKGYYDRYMVDFRSTAIGVIYSELLSDRLPRGRYDRRADLVVTEKETIFLQK